MIQFQAVSEGYAIAKLAQLDLNERYLVTHNPIRRNPNGTIQCVPLTISVVSHSVINKPSFEKYVGYAITRLNRKYT